MKIKFSSQWRKSPLFLTTNMAAVMSGVNQFSFLRLYINLIEDNPLLIYHKFNGVQGICFITSINTL